MLVKRLFCDIQLENTLATIFADLILKINHFLIDGISSNDKLDYIPLGPVCTRIGLTNTRRSDVCFDVLVQE